MMIKIERASPPEDTGLDKKRKKELRRIRELAESGELKSKDFKALWSEAKVKKFLYESQYGKCCYCERWRDKIEVDVEHFRPKAEVEEAEDHPQGNAQKDLQRARARPRELAGERHPGYWWLAYSWENLLIACKTCNQKYKKSKFPLKHGSERAYGENSDLGKEDPILINPLEEDPEEFIEYDLSAKLMAKAVGKCERGRRMVADELTGINDKKVMEERAHMYKWGYRICCAHLKNKQDSKLRSMGSESLRTYISRRSEFSGFARFYFRKKGFI